MILQNKMFNSKKKIENKIKTQKVTQVYQGF